MRIFYKYKCTEQNISKFKQTKHIVVNLPYFFMYLNHPSNKWNIADGCWSNTDPKDTYHHDGHKTYYY